MPRRRTTLTLMVTALVPAFVVVNGLVALARTGRAKLEHEWAERGAHDLAAGRASDAADDYYAAQAYSRDHGRYRLDLARALIAAARTSEARAELETLWSDAPGSGVVNLELARIAKGEGDVDDAARAYHAAIDGAWESNPAAARRSARLELAQLFVERGLLPQADAELTILLADPPVDPRAAVLAGRIAFSRGDYRTAAAQLGAAGPLDRGFSAMLDVATRALALDPDARGITSRERVRRVARLFSIALEASRRCASPAAAAMRARLEAAAPSVTERTLSRDPDASDATLELLTAAASVVHSACPAAGADDRAMALVVQRPRL
jgi:thioredoxin-like negative regulator of GroEL